MSLTQKPLRRMLLLALLALALIAVVVIVPTTAPAAASRSASVWAVSYTHLDVYKRQPPSSARPWPRRWPSTPASA